MLPLLRELRPHLTAESFEAVCREGYPQRLRFTLAYWDGARVGVAGWRLVATTNAMRKLTVDDLVTTAASRLTGVGRALLRDLERRERDAGYTFLDLDSGGLHRTMRIGSTCVSGSLKPRTTSTGSFASWNCPEQLAH